MIMQKKQKQGFTLIEILIVVAIIAILASVVLVGLGPTQQQGRDARRLSDLREAQTALELYYNKNGVYPDGATWDAMRTALVGGSIGVSQIPNDPSTNATYYYQSFSGDSTYVIGAKLESANNSVFTGYAAPSIGTPSGLTCLAADKQYCLSL
jgi:prepilin-type N-terminal cleavage/methylation domain-containing protein